MRTARHQRTSIAYQAAWRCVSAAIVAALAGPALGQSTSSEKPVTPPATGPNVSASTSVSTSATAGAANSSIQSPTQPSMTAEQPTNRRATEAGNAATDGVTVSTFTTTDPARSSTEVEEEETTLIPTGFVVIDNATNPEEGMSRRVVNKLFLKQIRKWEAWDRSVVPVNLPTKSETRSLFSKEVHSMRTYSVEEFWSNMIFSGRGSPPKVMNSDKAVIAFVAKNLGAVGYVSNLAVLPATVKPLAITD